MNDLDDITVLSVLAALGIGVYLVYDWYTNGDAGPTDNAGQTSSILGLARGTNSVDPVTGNSNGFLNGLANLISPQSNPGGGEVAGSAETLTGADSSFWSDPFGALSTIVTPSDSSSTSSGGAF